ncbi:hypothetical protein EJ08DRAFT_436999 [Tothia fuscella]|uniref:Pre-rRNA-processing protein RIX1 n=1 Tax=Tothia fuscella TaxID=1048955 RepID=A0A9P4P089_9PEZI|nr:hypothetical protein EJ08DRAFT_436999 [Tothia fuscella]
MAPIAIDDRQSSSLRAITFRLTSTPTVNLPKISPHIAAQLISCKQILSASHDAVSKEDAALLHSFKTRLSSLLQDRSVEGRWSAVVLIKSVVELGGSEFLLGEKERCGGWIRGLTGILRKPDPSSTKHMVIITLTRMFLLTRDHQTLLRELTTPSLPPYITACLNLMEKNTQPSLVEPVLESLSHLIPRHPTIFRSFITRIRALALRILSKDPFNAWHADSYTPPLHLRTLAQKILVQLHQCAQKSGSAEEWNLAVRAIVASTHASVDQIFRAISEDWESVAGVRSTLEVGQTMTDQPERDEVDQVGLSSWKGLRSGSERILVLLGMLRRYISVPGASAVPLRLGVTVDLLTRVMSLRVPMDRKAAAWSRNNNQISRAEREELWSVLPSIHVAAVEVFLAIIQRLDAASTPINAQLLDLLPWLFESESSDVFLRTATYKAITSIVKITGPYLSKSSVSAIEAIIQYCCRDLMTTTPDAYPGLYESAYNLLPILLGTLPAQHIPVPARTELDRVAVLLKHEDALTASVLNPNVHKPSILPLMATLCPKNLATEALLRPRMPVIRTLISTNTQHEEEEEEAEQHEEEPVQNGKIEYTDQDLQNHIALTDVDVEEPEKVVDEPEKLTETTTTFASLTTKRTLEEPAVPVSPPKRMRREIEPLQLPVAKMENSTITQSEEIDTLMSGEEDDSDDGSDFEIPTLVMRGDSDDDDDDDDDDDEEEEEEEEG